MRSPNSFPQGILARVFGPLLLLALVTAAVVAVATEPTSAQRRQCDRPSDCQHGLTCSPDGRCRAECATTRDCDDGKHCVRPAPDTYPMCVARGAIAREWFPDIERATDRPGSDIAAFWLDRADPLACHSECLANDSCVAWTYVAPGEHQLLPRCWLKRAAGQPRRHPRAVSAVLTDRVGRVGGEAREAR